MSRLLSLFSVVFLTLFIVGCAKTQYNYIPPAGNAEKQCTYHCGAGKNACERICRFKNESCLAKTGKQALAEYNAYKNEQIRHGKRVTKSLYDFESSQYCFKSCDCVNPYNTCYSACGGRVVERN